LKANRLWHGTLVVNQLNSNQVYAGAPSPDVAATDLSQSITQNINSKSTLPK